MRVWFVVAHACCLVGLVCCCCCPPSLSPRALAQASNATPCTCDAYGNWSTSIPDHPDGPSV